MPIGILTISRRPKQNLTDIGTSQIIFNPAEVRDVVGHPVHRAEEIFRSSGYLATLFFCCGSVPIIVTLATFGTFVAIDPEKNVLTADKVFTCLALFNLLRWDSECHAISAQFSPSIKRI